MEICFEGPYAYAQLQAGRSFSYGSEVSAYARAVTGAAAFWSVACVPNKR
jgi:hypothetical protein